MCLKHLNGTKQQRTMAMLLASFELVLFSFVFIDLFFKILLLLFFFFFYFLLGMCYRNGIGCAIDQRKFKEWFTIALKDKQKAEQVLQESDNMDIAGIVILFLLL